MAQGLAEPQMAPQSLPPHWFCFVYNQGAQRLTLLGLKHQLGGAWPHTLISCRPCSRHAQPPYQSVLTSSCLSRGHLGSLPQDHHLRAAHH